jgi:AmmeMemoRadiSam system protein B
MLKKRQQGLKKRSPVVNGIYYPKRQRKIAGKLLSWGLNENTASSGRQAILAPHGAWDLTGSIAASAFSGVQKKQGGKNISRVLLLGTHHQSNEDGIYLTESDSFETPLGNLNVDQNFNHELASCSTLIRINDIPHLSEHSVEVLLPFVKYCFPDASIVPILMSGKSRVFISTLSKALRITMDDYFEESLIVISSTISQSFDPAIALSMANEFHALLESMDSRAFCSRLADGCISACGSSLIGAILESGLLEGRQFSAIPPMIQGKGEQGETVYYGAFGV